jgi:iron complex outermembrane receptor protein
MYVLLVMFWLTLALAVPAAAQSAASPQGQPGDSQNADEPVTYEETVVVSASKVEQQLINAPATVSVVTTETIQNSPATNVGDLLRTVPGMNVSQISARDVNLTSRGATSTLSTSQLAVVDGRSVYLDFFGMIMWDFLPTNPNDIRQIEVIRGPASAVWGANAMTGVVNVITKTPRELAAQGGNTFTFGVGGFGRAVEGRDQGIGALFYINGSHAEAVNDRWSYKVSAGYLTQDAMARPTGTIANPFNTPYPGFQNQGSTQPKFDTRVDYELPDSARLTFAGGLAGTDGIIHTGIGPFDIASGSRMSYLTTRYQKGGRRIAFFTNLLDGEATNLLQRGPTGQPLPLFFDTKTFDIEANDVRTVGTRHVLSYGGNYRHNRFVISLTPSGNRNEGGGYLQDEMFLNDYLRWVVGGRLDKFSSIDGAVFSPRTTLLIKPQVDQTFRVSLNRAFRAPSFINNNLDTTILYQVNLGAISPLLSQFVFPVRAVGNADLSQETMTSFELGYTGVALDRATLSAAVYWNHIGDAVSFTQVGRYTGANPPPTWPAFIPPAVVNLIPQPGLPSLFTYQNLGTVKDKGIELGIDAAVNQYVNVLANYSYQWDPVVEGFDFSEVNHPANNRFNAGFDFNYSRYFGNFLLSYTGEAYWQDVLDVRFYGTTKAYTLVNTGLGARWRDGRIVTSLKITNLANKEVLQHIFGDVSKRQVVGEIRYQF